MRNPEDGHRNSKRMTQRTSCRRGTSSERRWLVPGGAESRRARFTSARGGLSPVIRGVGTEASPTRSAEGAGSRRARGCTLPGELGLGRRPGRRERWRLAGEAQVREEVGPGPRCAGAADPRLPAAALEGDPPRERLARPRLLRTTRPSVSSAISVRVPLPCGEPCTSGADTRCISSAQLVRVGCLGGERFPWCPRRRVGLGPR